MLKQIKTLTILVLSYTVLLISACKSNLVPGYEYNIGKNGVDISKHNLEYLSPPEKLFVGSTQKQIDKFDAKFIKELNNNLNKRGYALNQTGEMQTYRLKDCLIEFSKTKPKISMNGIDSIYKSNLLSTIICTEITDTTKLFFAYNETELNYNYLPIKSNKFANIDSTIWQFSKNYGYSEIPFNETETQVIASELAKKTFEKIDTTNVQYFKKNYPDIYSSKYRKSTYAKGSGLFVAMVLLLIVVLIP
jgi:hypothetical protein